MSGRGPDLMCLAGYNDTAITADKYVLSSRQCIID